VGKAALPEPERDAPVHTKPHEVSKALALQAVGPAAIDETDRAFETAGNPGDTVTSAFWPGSAFNVF